MTIEGMQHDKILGADDDTMAAVVLQGGYVWADVDIACILRPSWHMIPMVTAGYGRHSFLIYQVRVGLLELENGYEIFYN